MLNPDDERSFPQDKIDDPDNGAYINQCIDCKHTFTGHKHRFQCKMCSDAQKAKLEAMTPIERRRDMWKKVRAIKRFFQKSKNAEG